MTRPQCCLGNGQQPPAIPCNQCDALQATTILRASLAGTGNCGCLDGIVAKLTYDASIQPSGGWRTLGDKNTDPVDDRPAISCSTGSTQLSILFHCIFTDPGGLGAYNWAINFASVDIPPSGSPHCSLTSFLTTPGNSCMPLRESATFRLCSEEGQTDCLPPNHQLDCCAFDQTDSITVVITA